MANRLDLQAELENLLGSRNVYFQPPTSVSLIYPCIVYRKSNVNKFNADDKLYGSTNQYAVTVIDADPDSKIPDKILEHFAMCRLDRSFYSDNLNHNIFTLYY